MNSGTLKAAVVGLGVGERHIAAYSTTDGVDVTVVCDNDPARLEEVAHRYSIPNQYTDYREIIDRSDIDVVSICSHDDAHGEQVCDFLEAGKHVMVEKPVCQRPEELDAIRASLSKHPTLRLSSNLPLRTCPRFMAVRDQIRSGTIGKVYCLEADYLWGRPHKVLQGWRRQMPYYSVVLGASVHMIDLVLWLTGELPVEVSGYGGNKAMAEFDLPFDDLAVNLLRFADGTVAKVASHAGCVHPHFHKLSVFGTKRTFVHDLAGAYWVNSDDPKGAVPVPENAEYPGREHRGAIISSFVDHIRDPSRPPLVTSEDVFNSMRVTLAAAEAIEQNIAVPINFPVDSNSHQEMV